MPSTLKGSFSLRVWGFPFFFSSTDLIPRGLGVETTREEGRTLWGRMGGMSLLEDSMAVGGQPSV